MSTDAILGAVRALRLEDPGLGVKPLVARLREQAPDLGAGAKEVREVLKTLDEERAAAEAAAAPPVSAASSAGAGADGGAGAVDLGDATPAHWLTCAKCQARIPERVASCTLCATLWSQCVIPPDEAHPVYCSERCKRKHMPEHRSWHRAFATKLEHKKELLQAQSSETREKMIADVTDDYDLENVAALELLDSGNSKEAVKRLKQCIKQRPWEPEAYFNLGSVYIQKADRPKALQAFSDAFSWHLEGCMGWAQSAVMVHQCVLSLRKRGTPKAEWAHIYPAWHHDPEICLQVADMAREVNGDDDGVWAIRADALERLGRKKEAKEAHAKARELHAMATRWGWGSLS